MRGFRRTASSAANLFSRAYNASMHFLHKFEKSIETSKRYDRDAREHYAPFRHIRRLYLL